MSGPDVARDMQAMARKDFAALQTMQGMPAVADEIAGFHAQQAIEKSLKAWIAHLGCSFPYTHNLVTLLNLLEREGCEVASLLHLVKYDAFAVQFRYIQMEEADTRLDREEAVRQVAHLIDHVERIVGGSD